jgi:hypothetical protein
MKIWFGIMVIAMLVLSDGCGDYGDGGIQKVKEATSINPFAGKTVGNHTYLPLDLDNVWQHTEEVLQVLDAFEKANPRVEITSWHLLMFGNHKAQGVWIDHRPLPAKCQNQ